MSQEQESTALLLEAVNKTQYGDRQKRNLCRETISNVSRSYGMMTGEHKEASRDMVNISLAASVLISDIIENTPLRDYMAAKYMPADFGEPKTTKGPGISETDIPEGVEDNPELDIGEISEEESGEENMDDLGKLKAIGASAGFISYHGIESSKLKSAIQKHIRRGNLEETAKAVFEMKSVERLLELTDRTSTIKGFITNLFNRLSIIACEDISPRAVAISTAVCSWCLYCGKGRGGNITGDEVDPRKFGLDGSDEELWCIIKLLSEAPKARTMSHIAKAFGDHKARKMITESPLSNSDTRYSVNPDSFDKWVDDQKKNGVLRLEDEDYEKVFRDTYEGKGRERARADLCVDDVPHKDLLVMAHEMTKDKDFNAWGPLWKFIILMTGKKMSAKEKKALGPVEAKKQQSKLTKEKTAMNKCLSEYLHTLAPDVIYYPIFKSFKDRGGMGSSAASHSRAYIQYLFTVKMLSDPSRAMPSMYSDPKEKDPTKHSLEIRKEIVNIFKGIKADSEKKTTKDKVRRLRNMKFDITIPDYALDIHTGHIKKGAKGRDVFVTEGAYVEDEDKAAIIPEFEEVYVKYHKDALQADD